MAAAAERAPAPRRRAWLDALAGQLLALGGAFGFAAAIGSVIILAYGENPTFVYRVVWEFSTATASDVARVLAIATPLIFSGLAVAVAFRAGLFNIGVEGQYRVGMAAAAAGAAWLGFLPGPLLMVAVVLCAVGGATAWAWIPAYLKVRTGAHEVVTTIMMNGIATSLVAWAILNPLRTPEEGLIDLRTAPFPENALIPTISESLGLQESIPPSAHLTWLFPVAILACIAVWYLLYRRRLGYEIRAVGSSAGSAEAGGISIGSTQIRVMLISGMLAGFVGLNHILGDKGYLGSNYETGLGFAGIAVAFLGRNHPAGVFLAAILVGMLQRGQDGIAVTTDLPTEILIILQGLLILSVVIAHELVSRALVRRRQRAMRAEEGVARAAA